MKVKPNFSALLISIFFACGNGSEKSDAYGNFEADEIIISANSSGELKQFELEEGQKLHKGEAIGYIDTVTLNLSRQEIQANLEVIQSQVNNINAEIKVLQSEKDNVIREMNRTKNLLASKAATQQQLDDLQGKVTVLNQQISARSTQKKSVESQLKAGKVSLKQIDEAIEKAIIESPIDATVLNKIAQANQLVMPGSPLFTIADLSSVFLRAYVSGEQLSQIKLGQQVSVLIDAPEGGLANYDGTITWISDESEFTPKIIQTKEERVDMVYAIKIKVINDGKLKIGMPGEVRFGHVES